MTDDNQEERARGWLVNDRKFAIAFVAVICTTVLIAMGRVEADKGLVLISSVTMYIIGNGVTSWRGREATPIVKPKVIEDRRAADPAEGHAT